MQSNPPRREARGIRNRWMLSEVWNDEATEQCATSTAVPAEAVLPLCRSQLTSRGNRSSIESVANSAPNTPRLVTRKTILRHHSKALTCIVLKPDCATSEIRTI